MAPLKNVDLLTRGELKGLIEERKDKTVSIYMPVHRVAVTPREDPILLDKLIRDAEKQLVARGMRQADAKELLIEAARLIDPSNLFFWKNQGEGLAVLVSPRRLSYFRLPFSVKAQVVLGSRFYVKPLFRLFSPETFFVLVFERETIRLYQGSAQGIRRVTPRGEASLSEVLRYEELRQLLMFHGGTREQTPATENPPVAVGGLVLEDSRDSIFRYFERVDNTIKALLKGEEAPLLLAGIPELFPIYREANSYPQLMQETIHAPSTPLRDDELHQRAWSYVAPAFDKKLQEARKHFVRLRGTERASNDLVQIVRAAHDGRIHALFLPPTLEQWGTYDPVTGAVRLEAAPSPTNHDLLDEAALQVLLKGGRVYAVEPENLPDGGIAAAILRY